jgi:hypothetical protein
MTQNPFDRSALLEPFQEQPDLDLVREMVGFRYQALVEIEATEVIGGEPMSGLASGTGPLIAVGPDLGAEFELDQLLTDQCRCFFDEVKALNGSERVE